MARTFHRQPLALVRQGGLGRLEGSVRRTLLPYGVWVDIRPGWLGGSTACSDTTRLRALAGRATPSERTIVQVPRLLCFYDGDWPLPDPVLAEAREVLGARYSPGYGESLCTVSLSLYRDGRDSNAWHEDTLLRKSADDTVVAIVSLGAPRTVGLRPRDGGSAVRHDLGHGDLLVMGGACQRAWEYAVPKTDRAIGPWISVQFRFGEAGRRGDLQA